MKGTVKIWTDLSLSDLKSARLLYDNGHFRTSYFLFQQATEKANKAFALLTGHLSNKEFQNIKHDQLKIYRKAIVKQEGDIKTLISALKPCPKIISQELVQKANFVDYHKSLIEGLRFIDGFRNIDLVNISIEDLNSILGELKKLKETQLKLPQDNQMFKNQFLAIADWIGRFEKQEALSAKSELIDLLNDKEKSAQLYDLLKKQIFPMTIDIAFTNMTLFFCINYSST